MREYYFWWFIVVVIVFDSYGKEREREYYGILCFSSDGRVCFVFLMVYNFVYKHSVYFLVVDNYRLKYLLQNYIT